MKIKTTLVLALVATFAVMSCNDLFAINSKAGTHAYSFLKIPVGAKASAMAGAYTGLSADVYGIYFNPAGIAQVPGSEIAGSYDNYLAGIQSGYMSYVLPWGQEGKIGVAFNYLNYGSTPRTDLNGDQHGEFGGGDLAVSVTAARMWAGETDDLYEASGSASGAEDSHPRWNGLSAGVTAKYIYESLDVYRSDALALDLGILWGLKDNRTRLGVSASNLGFQMKGLSSGHKDPLPAIVRAGVGHQLKAAPLVIGVDAVKPLDNDFNFAAGVNYVHFYPLEIRAGYTTLGEDFKTGSDRDRWGGLSFGLGFKVRKLTVDYALIPYADLGTSHRIGFSSRW